MQEGSWNKSLSEIGDGSSNRGPLGLDLGGEVLWQVNNRNRLYFGRLVVGIAISSRKHFGRVFYQVGICGAARSEAYKIGA